MERAHDRFVFRIQTIESALRERLRAYEFLLQSGADLFAASEEVTRAEWRTYVTGLKINKYYQGVQGLGFSKRILSSEKGSSRINVISALPPGKLCDEARFRVSGFRKNSGKVQLD